MLFGTSEKYVWSSIAGVSLMLAIGSLGINFAPFRLGLGKLIAFLLILALIAAGASLLLARIMNPKAKGKDYVFATAPIAGIFLLILLMFVLGGL